MVQHKFRFFAESHKFWTPQKTVQKNSPPRNQ